MGQLKNCGCSCKNDSQCEFQRQTDSLLGRIRRVHSLTSVLRSIRHAPEHHELGNKEIADIIDSIHALADDCFSMAVDASIGDENRCE